MLWQRLDDGCQDGQNEDKSTAVSTINGLIRGKKMNNFGKAWFLPQNIQTCLDSRFFLQHPSNNSGAAWKCQLLYIVWHLHTSSLSKGTLVPVSSFLGSNNVLRAFHGAQIRSSPWRISTVGMLLPGCKKLLTFCRPESSYGFFLYRLPSSAESDARLVYQAEENHSRDAIPIGHTVIPQLSPTMINWACRLQTTVKPVKPLRSALGPWLNVKKFAPVSQRQAHPNHRHKDVQLGGHLSNWASQPLRATTDTDWNNDCHLIYPLVI